MKLRPYQQAAVDAVIALFEAGEKSVLVVMATGLGKTITFAAVIDRWLSIRGGRGKVVAHREELIFQAAKKIRLVTGKQVDIEMAELQANKGLFKAPVVVSTIQSQNAGCEGAGRKSLFDPEEFSLLVIDEGHHGVANSYKKVTGHYTQNEELKVLGVTATADRGDKKALGQVYDKVAFNYPLPDAIRDGWLVPIRQHLINCTDLDISGCRATAKGDINEEDLSRQMIYEAPLHQIAWPTYHIATGRKTLLFATSIAHGEMLTKIFNRHEEGCARFVHGKTEKEERRQMFKDYGEGKFHILVNVGVATEGFDEPGIKVVAMARLTTIRSLYEQMGGRGTRPSDEIAHLLGNYIKAEERRALIAGSDKPCLEIIDFVGNSGRHKLVNSGDILGGDYSPAARTRATKKATEAEGPVDMEEMLEVAVHELADEEDALAHIKAKANYTKSEVDPFDIFDINVHRQKAWETGDPTPATPGQIKMLKWQGIPTADITKRKASQLIGAVMKRKDKGLCTFKQAKILKKNGYDSDMQMDKAKAVLARIASKKPVSPY